MHTPPPVSRDTPVWAVLLAVAVIVGALFAVSLWSGRSKNVATTATPTPDTDAAAEYVPHFSPSPGYIPASGGSVTVPSYVRRDGTQVHGYTRHR